MSISPISSSSLYLQQISFYKNIMADDFFTNNLLLKNGIIPSSDKAKNAAKLQEIIKNNSVQKLQNGQEGDLASTDETVVQPWFSIMYELGLSPSGEPEEDYNEIVDELSSRLRNATSEDEFGHYQWMMSTVQDMFIDSGVSISQLQEGNLPFGKEMEILANYNKSNVEKSKAA